MPKASLEAWLSSKTPHKTTEERANEREQQDLDMAIKLSLQEEERVKAEQIALLSQCQTRRASIEQTITNDTFEDDSISRDFEQEDQQHSDPLLSSPLSPSLTRQQHNGYLSDEELDDFVRDMLATSNGHLSSNTNTSLSKRLRRASLRRGKRSIAEAVAESEDNRRKRPTICSSSTNTYYRVDSAALESEFENAGFADSAVGLAWESKGQSRYL